MVDSADSERLEEAYDELVVLMTEKQLKDAMLLVFANKQVSIGAWPHELNHDHYLPFLYFSQGAWFI